MTCRRCHRPLLPDTTWDTVLCKRCERIEHRELVKRLLPWERSKKRKRGES